VESEYKDKQKGGTMSDLMFNLTEFTRLAQTGRVEDIDELLRILQEQDHFIVQKMIDYALGLVGCGEGRERIRYYLFNGSPVQRNYAALYFKRLGHIDVLEEAVRLNCIDEVQAFCR